MALQKFYDPETTFYGYKNEGGEMVIVPAYEKAEDFEDGFAEVGDGQMVGAINEEGTLIVPFQYDFILSAKNWVQAYRGDLKVLYDCTGEQILERGDLLQWHFPEGGIIRIKRESGWGCIDMKGNEVVPCIYQSLGVEKHGLRPFFHHGLWGWLDQYGKEKITARFEQLGFWNNELWWGLIKDEYVLYNLDGAEVCKRGWSRIVPPGSSGAAVKTVSGWEFIDEAFDTIIKFPSCYDWVEFFSEGMAAVKRAGKWGFIDDELIEVIPAAYKNVGAFSEGLAAVEMDGNWGFIDKQGTTVIPFIYRDAGRFSDGKARVEQAYTSYYIDKAGYPI